MPTKKKTQKKPKETSKKKTKKAVSKKKVPKVKPQKKEKKTVVAKTKTEIKEKPAKKIEKYIETIGRRKRSIARIRILPKDKEGFNFFINKKTPEKYFPEEDLRKAIFAPIEKSSSKILKTNKIDILVKGGGKRGQAEAISLGIARALLKNDKNLKTLLKSHKFLTRDPRKKERKKFGLKKARKAPQWQKR
jgi:small subunit ribosomal protein S9